MLIRSITLNNIRSYKNQEIIFPVGSTLLSGDIGSGKTSVLLGIEFALFGLQPGQRGASLLKNISKEGGVKMNFEINEKEVVIERTLKRKKTISQDYCSITIDGQKKEISVSEIKNFVLELLNYPKEFAKKQNLLYKFTVYTPQEEMKQIILQDSETRVNTLRHIFGIDKYKKILENTSIVVSKIREEQRKKEGLVESLEQDKLDLITKENELETKYYNLESLEKQLFLKTEKRKKIQEEQDENRKKIDEKKRFEQEIEKTKIMLLNKKETISNNMRTMDELNKQIQELNVLKFDESEISKKEGETNLLKKQRETLNEQILQTSSQINSLELNNEEYRKLEQKFSKLEICPTCLQNVEASYRANVINKTHADISENKNKIGILEQKKKEVSEKIRQINEKISLQQNELNEIKILQIKLRGLDEKQMRLREIEKTNILVEKDINLLDKHTEILKKSVFELVKFDNVYGLKQEELNTALEEEKLAEIKIAELKKEIEFFSDRINELNKKIEGGKENKKILNYLVELEGWLSKKFLNLISFIEKNVMVKLKSDFSELFGKWFSMLVSDSLTARVDDNFTPIVEQQDYEIDYTYLSGGERTAVALAYRLALNQLINSILSRINTKDIVILDEPTDGFSEQQLDKMRDVLQQLNVKQLILVSHEQKIESFVENVLKFRKEEGVTKIEK